MSILQEAHEIIYGERVQTYGTASKTFTSAAIIMSQLTGKIFFPEDIAKVQIIMKLLRNQNSPNNKDHLTDACGYLGILSDIQVENGDNDE